MKFYISKPTGSIMWYEKDTPMFAPIGSDDTVNTEEGGEAEFSLVGDEKVTLDDGEEITLSNYYKSLRPDIQN